MTEGEIRNAVQHAIERIRAENPSLDFQRVHERSIAHRLAVHLEPIFHREWNVDCEYDGDGQLKKALDGIKSCNSKKKTNEIRPDIIVHHRGQPGRAHNLLVVEIKKMMRKTYATGESLSFPRSHAANINTCLGSTSMSTAEISPAPGIETAAS